MHKVSVLAMDGFVPFDLSVPCEVFGRASGVASYNVRVCSEATEVRSRNFTLQTEWGLEELASADTILVPGVGAQEGSLRDTVLAGLTKDKDGIIVNASRSIIYASRDSDYATAARAAAAQLRDQIMRYQQGRTVSAEA